MDSPTRTHELVDTGSGDVEIRNARGRVWVRSVVGSITGAGLQGSEADVKTEYGDVSLQFDRSPGLARAVRASAPSTSPYG